MEADLLSPGGLGPALDGVDGVIHLAAARADWGISAAGYWRDNVEATRALLREGIEADVEYWQFYSSVSAVGPGERPRGEEAELRPIDPYGRSKAEAERLFQRAASQDQEVSVDVLRPSVIFGPGNPPDTNLFRLTEALHRGRFLMVGNGRTVKSTSYIENIVAASLFLLERERGPGVATFVYVDEPLMETRQIVKEICAVLGQSPPRVHVPEAVAVLFAKPLDLVARLSGKDLPITSARIAKFCRPTAFDASRIRAAGFRQPVDNETAIRRMVAWYLGTESESLARMPEHARSPVGS